MTRRRLNVILGGADHLPVNSVLTPGQMAVSGSVGSTTSTGQGSRAEDETALEALYASTSGWTNSTGWAASGMDLSTSIYGVTTDTIGGELRVTQLNIRNNSITGNIPTDIGNLKVMTYLDIEQNDFGGVLPDELYNCTALEYVYLAGNPDYPPGSWGYSTGNYHPGKSDQITNRFSSCNITNIGNLTNLVEFRFERQGNFTGSIPAGIGNCTNLRALLLWGEFLDYSSGLTGSLPPEIGNCTQLELLEFGRQAIGGALPTELGNCTLMKSCRIGGNNVTSFPTSIQNLTELRRWDVSRAKLDMPLPTYFWNGNFTRLHTLRFSFPESFTGLDGDISALNWGNLPDAASLSLNANEALTGQISDTLDQINPDIFDISRTDASWRSATPTEGVTGPIPSGIGGWTRSRNVYLSDNNLSGPIPTDAVNAQGQLQRYWIYGNKFVFEDIIPLLNAGIESVYGSVSYSPQADIGNAASYDVETGASITVDDFAGITTHVNNSFQWQFNGSNISDGGPYSGTSTDTLVVSNFSASEEGNYRLVVTNPDAPSLTLTSETITLSETV